MEYQEAGYKRQLKKVVYALAKCCPIRPRNGLEAAALCSVLHSYNIASTLGKLSKAGDDPERVVKEYLTVSDSLKEGPWAERFYLSVKPPALQFNPKLAAEIVGRAFQNGHGVHFDAHGFAYAEPTLRLLEGMMALYSSSPARADSWKFGLTLPSRWKRSLLDAGWVVEHGVRPRLVKGDFPAAYADEAEPVQGFLALVDQLAGKVPELALATHDCALTREAVSRLKGAGTAVQLELFFGMPSGEMMALANELQVPVRFYVPYGDTLIIYVIRDLLTNPHKIFRADSYQRFGSQEQKLANIIGRL